MTESNKDDNKEDSEPIKTTTVPFQDDSLTLELFTRLLHRIKISESKIEITTIKMSVDTVVMAAEQRLRDLDIKKEKEKAGIDKEDEAIVDHHEQADKDKERERLDNLNQ